MTRERPVPGVPEPQLRLLLPVPLAQSLHQALLGAVFPLTAEQLTWVARENEAPAGVLSLLGALPRGHFGSLEAVAAALELGTAHAGTSPDAPAMPLR